MVKTLINLMKYFFCNTPHAIIFFRKLLIYFFRYCPDCRKNQCATKTLTVWRFPDFLILYLKRYIQNHFHLKHYLIVLRILNPILLWFFIFNIDLSSWEMMVHMQMEI